ncbi:MULTISPECIES: type II toxin-antitoxin system VapC family toxin [Pseudomonas]|uniref:type II toxin-antitoxin system VapC family toxin n=1 Tax=Pseudomonas TaxID=286 RepID=UPI000D702480|nr:MULTISPECIES: type II toxin-antitoxin system VapC family toxin [unclassified Pseudomonas]MED5606263.1 type II toxin-antitoxin system VapC family toxin [Pseudomonas sp. JH-2]PWU31772.1 VapC toxin family PIN domain ribonuclease [Pseudomonas sp. RW407]
MVKALFDTNILIDYLNGHEQARDELRRHDDPAISIVTWMEVMIGATPATAAATRAFLDSFALVPLDASVAERAVAVRQALRVKLPDAIIKASAEVQGRLLVTRNTRDFPADDVGVRLPYSL